MSGQSDIQGVMHASTGTKLFSFTDNGTTLLDFGSHGHDDELFRLLDHYVLTNRSADESRAPNPFETRILPLSFDPSVWNSPGGSGILMRSELASSIRNHFHDLALVTVKNLIKKGTLSNHRLEVRVHDPTIDAILRWAKRYMVSTEGHPRRVLMQHCTLDDGSGPSETINTTNDMHLRLARFHHDPDSSTTGYFRCRMIHEPGALFNTSIHARGDQVPAVSFSSITEQACSNPTVLAKLHFFSNQ